MSNTGDLSQDISHSPANRLDDYSQDQLKASLDGLLDHAEKFAGVFDMKAPHPDYQEEICSS